MHGLALLATLATSFISITDARPHLAARVADSDWFHTRFAIPAASTSLPETEPAEVRPSSFGQYARPLANAKVLASPASGYQGNGFAPHATFNSPHFTGRPVGQPHGSGYAQPTVAYSTAASGRPFGTATGIRATGTGSTTVATKAPLPKVLRGVNLGGWLILEKWMNADVFNGTDANTVKDQYTFDQTEGAAAKLKQHWDTYITEQDIEEIASHGMNAVRIPIGYWAYNTYDSPYITGADAYLEKAIGWCRKHGLRVLVDCHGSIGSQNGFDNSGRNGNVNWQDKTLYDGQTNMQKSIDVLQTMAKKYGSEEYADVVYALELVNEPISWGANDFATTQTWAQDAYKAVRAAAANKDMVIVMHDSFKGPSSWTGIGSKLNGNSTLAQATFAIDEHLYQNQVAAESQLTQAQHIEKACSWANTDLLPRNSTLPVYVGEFSTQTNICANPDGSTLGGDVCTESGCQCSCNVPLQYWNKPIINATRMFVEAQLDAFEHASSGWFMWSWKGPDAWGMQNAIKYGLMGQKVTDRMFPNQCKF